MPITGGGVGAINGDLNVEVVDARKTIRCGAVNAGAVG